MAADIDADAIEPDTVYPDPIGPGAGVIPGAVAAVPLSSYKCDQTTPGTADRQAPRAGSARLPLTMPRATAIVIDRILGAALGSRTNPGCRCLNGSFDD
ncbi:hypothetical protein LC092_10210 [Stappia stellulata]|uniref:hypothetical protein n=1 Tax=Stappia stellulata TaxID=71235 RepID=UPI001CD625BB|nr:hypothetical protein [Stappia stellulata]MCA1242810.1 hypothetical protein [Stappia stellulata]